MKTKVLLIAPLLALVVGCAALDRMYDKHVTRHDAQTNVVTKYSTNAIVTWATNQVTDSAGNVKLVVNPTTNLTVIPVTLVSVIPEWFETNLVARPTVSEGISAGGAIAGSTGVPFAGVGAILLGWLYTGYAAFRNRKGMTALVTGIEAGRQILQETPEGQKLDAKVKDALIDHQEVAGVLNLVSKIVNERTGDTVKS